MKKVSLVFLVLILLILTAILFLFIGSTMMSFFQEGSSRVAGQSVLLLKLEGVILDGEKFLKDLKKYRDNSNVKAVVVQINSPGGVVGPSQEINAELNYVRDELKKPVVAACGGMAASGAYYVAVAADKIVANPGSLMGSIGVIMEFVNLEDLYSWAKIKRYSISSGPFKGAGSEYRGLKDEERKLFQDMINEVHQQFENAVSKGRNLDLAKVKPYADGRIFTGQTGVDIGFVDQVGTLEDAIRLAAELAGIRGTPEIFEPPRRKPGIWDFVFSAEDQAASYLKPAASDFIKNQLRRLGQPLYLLPGVYDSL